VALARDGITMTPTLAGSLRNVLPAMQPYPASVAAFTRDGTPYDAGEQWRSRIWRETLERIRVEPARRLLRRRDRATARRGDGARRRHHHRWRTSRCTSRGSATPVRGTYRGYEVISMPPPSSGGVAMLQMLNILEGFDLAAWATTPPTSTTSPSDAAGVPRPRAVRRGPGLRRCAGGAADEQGVRGIAADVDRPRARDAVRTVEDLALPYESDQTTHYSVVDATAWPSA
jgi:gamma-glutamyltranspeptidase / glutathione hydrolase